MKPVPSNETITSSPSNGSRRRLLRGGLGVAPVLMTVASRPVMAGVCESASSHTSLSGSRVAAADRCSGGSPTYWMSRSSTSGSSSSTAYLMDVSTSTGSLASITFGSVFGVAGGYGDKTFLQVLESGHSSSSKDGLAAHLVAAVLNVQAGYTPATVLDVTRAQSIWSDYNALGYFEPTAGIRWDSAQIIDWLKTTMPLNG